MELVEREELVVVELAVEEVLMDQTDQHMDLVVVLVDILVEELVEMVVKV
jgi:hypothetical protein